MTIVFTCKECRMKLVQNKRVCYAYKYTDANSVNGHEVKSPGNFCPYDEGEPKWELMEDVK